eukprot:2122000-Amphidinium_carterae.1
MEVLSYEDATSEPDEAGRNSIPLLTPRPMAIAVARVCFWYHPACNGIISRCGWSLTPMPKQLVPLISQLLPMILVMWKASRANQCRDPFEHSDQRGKS